MTGVRGLLVGSSVLLAFASAPAHATPSALFGAGPRSQALAASGAAEELGVASVALNPAFLAGARPLALAGFQSARFELEGGGAIGDAAPASLLGFTLPVPLGSAARELTFGVLAATPPDLLVRAELPYAEEPQFPLLLQRAHAIDFAAGAGLHLGWLRLGLGVRALAGLEGNADVVNDEAGARTEVRDTLAPTLAPVAGLGIDLGFSDSAALIAKAALEARFDVDLHVGAVGSLKLPDLHIAGAAHYDPAELRAEWLHRFGPTSLRVALTYERWSDFDAFVDRTVECPPAQPGCTALPAEKVALADTLVPRVGLEHEFELGPLALAVRGGYFYEASPLPEQRGVANRFDNARHVFGLGYGVHFASVRLDLAYQRHALVPRKHHKMAGGEISTSGSVDLVALGLELEL